VPPTHILLLLLDDYWSPQLLLLDVVRHEEVEALTTLLETRTTRLAAPSPAKRGLDLTEYEDDAAGIGVAGRGKKENLEFRGAGPT
jgi:hypothetical protein